MSYIWYRDWDSKRCHPREDSNVFHSIGGNRLEGVKHFAVRNQLCSVDSEGNCPLSYAIKINSSSAIIDYLITEYTKISGKNPLLVAVQCQNLHVINTILNDPTKFNCLNCCDSAGYSPLAYAVRAGNKKIIDCLITAGADITKYEKNGKPPILIAVEKHDLEMVKYLIEKDTKQTQLCSVYNEGNCPLSYAMKLNLQAIIEYLLPKYTNINGNNPLRVAVQCQKWNVIRKILNDPANFKCLNYCDSTGCSPLAYAVKTGDKEIIDCLITAGADITKYEKNGKPPLSIAVEKQDLEMVKYLIEKGANRSVQSAFLAAIKTENLEIIKYLHTQGAIINNDTIKDGVTTLIKNENATVLIYLIENGAHIEDFKDNQHHQFLWKYVNEGNNDMISVLFQLGLKAEQEELNGYTLLTKAVEQENLKMVEQLVNAGATINKSDVNKNYPLGLAISKSSLEIVKFLIKSDANLEQVGSNGDTPLTEAIKQVNYEIVEDLVRAGASVNTPDKNWNYPLGLAISKSSQQIAEFLIRSDANVEQAGSNGYTPLTEAVEQEKFDIVKELVKAGASVNAFDKNKNYPLGLAISKSSQRIVEFLIGSGADMTWFSKEIEEFASWNVDFNIYLQSKIQSAQIVSESGHEEATY